MIKKAHFIGIGGIGMSALARILKQSGASVSGSDSKHTPLTDQLEQEGIALTNGSIPEEYEFLKILSDYYKGKVDISNEVLIEMRNCNVYLKNIKTYKELTIKNN